IRYWIVPQFEGATAEEAPDFLLEYSDPEAVEILPDSASNSGGMMGTLRFRKPGKYTLTIRHIYDDSLKKEYAFVVEGQPEAVSLTPKSLTLNPGKTRTLTPSLTPEGAETTYTWTSSNKKVATVKNGKVTTVGVGTAKITVKTANGKTATCTVTVKNPPEGVKLSKTSISLKKGETYSLKATLTPSNTYTTYTWTSSNKKVATVKNGKVTAVGKGTATITVKTANGKTATCKVTVK
ncbi:MAG: Ig-like domain-containing protein, partial [Lachnospiraceae bacterium]|nr:Ig-like domain-containing protein [Lachnospiraceae bacterium]